MKKIIWAFVLILLIAACAAGFVGWSLLYQNNIDLPNGKSTLILIPTGSDFNRVKDSLYKHNLIRQPWAFELLAKLKKYPAKVHPGRYRIRSGMNNKELVNLLKWGLQEPVRFTFNNVRTKAELASRVSAKIEADSSQIMDILNDRGVLEKYGMDRDNVLSLFIPNTYEFYWNTSADEFLSRMAKEYKAFWNDERKNAAREIGLKQSEVTTLASIVEEETTKSEEKPIVAGVYINRLHKGMRLEADPTLRWAWNDFSIHRVLKKHREINSPYNTYMYPGLPPGPICIPSIATVDSVLHYKRHNFLYFCAREDLSGYSNFACTYAEHMKNASRYQRELNKRKIRS